MIDNGNTIIKVVVRGTLPIPSRAGRYDNNYDNGYDNGYYYGQGEDNYGGGQNYGDYLVEDNKILHRKNTTGKRDKDTNVKNAPDNGCGAIKQQE